MAMMTWSVLLSSLNGQFKKLSLVATKNMVMQANLEEALDFLNS